MEAIKVIVVEDDIMIKNALKYFFNTDVQFLLVEVYGSVEDLQKGAPGVVEPDVVLMDIMLPGMSGIEGVEQVLSIWPRTKIIMNSVLNDNEAIYKSLVAGALGYVSKDMPISTIKEAVVTVYNGGSFMNPHIARKVVDYFQKSMRVREVLNEKEWNIANGIKNGLSYKLVAAENDMSIDGVRFYIQRIYRKLNIHSKDQLTKLLS